MCSGKVFFDISQKLEQTPPPYQVKVIRLEELAPFPVAHVKQHLGGAQDVVYVQEECMNEGAFQFAKLHLDRVLKKPLAYVGRPSQHSFATGAPANYKAESKRLWEDFEKAIYQ